MTPENVGPNPVQLPATAAPNRQIAPTLTTWRSTSVPVSVARINETSGRIIDTAMYIHRELGPGLLESVYAAVMAWELRRGGLHVLQEVGVPVVWGDVRLEVGFRADLIVERQVLVELKSQEVIAPVHKKQVLTYYRER